jgi:formylglycine-generating enzyme required for sulfatase activity/predicted phosphodiesterase/energy-coupling factor transporter ATP-binding protein EcfA2
MSEITILHLSDIHFKKKKEEENKTFHKMVQQQLIEAVKRHVKEHGHPDFVVITGDIAFSGKKHEYDEALEFFDGLKAVLPGETEFLAVPGNHDVDRDKVDDCFHLGESIVKKNLTDKFLEDQKKIKDFIDVKFKAYRGFIDRLNPTLYESKKKKKDKGKEKEKYFWVKNFDDKGVSFLGLNSAWASEGDNDHFNIALGFPQVHHALEQAKVIPNRIVLMHHPPFNWLKDLEYGNTRTEMFRQCRLLLHGHTHSDNALVFKDPADACICLGANASYTDDKEGFIGFQVIEVGFFERDTKVKVWPYIFSEKRNEFVPDRERWRGQGGKPYFKIEVLESIKEKKTDDGFVLLQIPEDYKNWVREFHSILPVDQLARKGEVVLISLPAVYIPLETANPFHKPVEEKDMKKRDEDVEGEPKEPAAINIEELIGRVNCLLLRGTAGMGKTTLIKHLAYSLTHGSGPEPLWGYLPVIVFLKDLRPIYESKLKEDPTHVTFELLLEEYFEKYQCPLPMDTVTAYLSQGRALLLLDGLDEVPEAIRDDLVDLVHRFQFQYKNNRFLITGRPHGIEGGGMLRFGKYLRDIEFLDDKKSRDFISRWFRAVSGQASGVGEVTAADMIIDIQQHEHAAVFTGNPLLLTALCIFYLVGGKRIPDQRADLYDRIVANLLFRRFHDPGDKDKVNRVREFLMVLAFTLQTRNARSIEACDAAELLQQNHPRKEDEELPAYKRRMDALLNEIEPMCGLLNRMASGEIEFTHLTFQEFLAANHMLDRDIDYKKYLEDPWWKETIMLYAGLMNLSMKTRSNDIVREMINMNKSPRIQVLGAEALRDFQSSKREEAVVQLAREKLLDIIESDAALQERFDAGEILGTLEDPRINALSPPMVTVEAGEFIRGSNEDDREKPVRNIYLDEFMIGKYPVTNQEFKVFIEAGGYGNKEFWTKEGWQWREKENISEPWLWHDRKWNGLNFPVLGVSWYEASAYAKWLSEKTGHQYILPSEAQWEKAARGSKGFSYPWGKKWKEDYCNSRECGLRRTSPVGIFPKGKSPYVCLDMAGNVWEWCADWYEDEYYKKGPDRNPQGPKNGSDRVLRGGGWFSGRHGCRAAYRSAALPIHRFRYGFRLARLL